MGRDPTTFEAWSVPNIGGPAHTRPYFGKAQKSVTDVSAMSPDVLAIAFHLSPLDVNQTCFRTLLYAAVQMIYDARPCDHVIPLLQQHHWLSAPQFVQFKHCSGYRLPVSAWTGT